MSTKNLVLTGLIENILHEINPKTIGDMVYLNDNTILTDKIVEIIQAVNARAKTTDVKSWISEVSSELETYKTSNKQVTDALQTNINKANSNLETYKTSNKQVTDALRTDITTVSGELETYKNYNKQVTDSLNTAVNARAKTTDVKSWISEVSSELETYKTSNKQVTDALNTAVNARAKTTDVKKLVNDLREEMLGDTPIEAYNTFTELAAYIEEHKEVSEALAKAIGDKADASTVVTIQEVLGVLGSLARKDTVSESDLDSTLQTKMNKWDSAVSAVTQIPIIEKDVTSLEQKCNQNTKAINEIKENIQNGETITPTQTNMRRLGKAAVWYHDYNAWGNSIEECARAIAKFDLIVGGGALHVEGQTSEEQIQIIKRARELNPDIKFFFYFSIASWRNDNGFTHILKPGGVWDETEAEGRDGYVRIHNKWEHYQFIERALHMGGYATEERELVEKDYTWTDEDGVIHTEDKYINLWAGGVAFDGVFYDDAGMDSDDGVINQGYKNLRDKSICLCEFTHNRGLSAFVNQLNEDLWYSDEVSDANPDGLPSAVDERDFLLVESTHTQHGDSSGYPLWRHTNNSKAIYNYYKNWYPTVGAKIVVNDYRVTALTKEECDKLRTFCIFDCIATGAHYLDFNGDLTWELPETAELFAVSEDEPYNNTFVEDGVYTLAANNHTLTVRRPSTVTTGSICDTKTLDKIEIMIDGDSFNNAYENAPALTKKVETRLTSVEDTLEEMQTSEKKTASVYHRMLIDDWGKEYIYTNLITDTWWEQLLADAEKHMTIESSDVETRSLHGIRLNGTQVTKDLTLDIEKLKGHTIEFGASVIENTTNLCGVNVSGHGWYPINNNNGTESTLYPDINCFVQRIAIPEGDERITATFRLVFNGSEGAVFNFTNFYCIDTNQFDEDMTKDWYTNIVPNAGKWTSYNYVDDYTVSQTDDHSFELTYDNDDSFHTWAGIAFNLPEGTFQQGHQYEIGCETFDTNLGEYNTDIAFRLYIWASPSGYEFWFPKTEKMVSKIYNEERHAKLLTLTDNRVITTGAGRLTLTNIASSNKNSAGEHAKAIIESLYIYDLDEEDIVFRGSDPSNSFLQICRVTDEKLAQEQKLIGDALYITDSGLMFMTDFNGNIVDLGGGSGNAGSTIKFEELQKRIKQNESDIIALKNKLENIGSGVKEDIDVELTEEESIELSDTISKLQKLEDINTAIVGWMTDLHILCGTDTNYIQTYGNATKIKKAVAVYNQVCDAVTPDVLILGGDYLENNTTTTSDAVVGAFDVLKDIFEKCDDTAPIAIIKGNHDDNTMNTDYVNNYINDATLWKLFANKNANKTMRHAGYLERGYGYYDIPNKKIRVFFLNTIDIPTVLNTEENTINYKGQWITGFRQEQLQFVADHLKFTEEGWHVICFSHHPLVPDMNIENGPGVALDNGGFAMLTILNAFNKKLRGVINVTKTDFESTVTYDFSENKNCKIIACVNGHLHRDDVVYYNDICLISTRAVAGLSTYEGHTTAHCYFLIDRVNEQLHMIYNGDGEDTTFDYGGTGNGMYMGEYLLSSPFTWSINTVNDTSGELVSDSQNMRLSTNEILKFSDDVTIRPAIPSAYPFKIVYFDETGAFIADEYYDWSNDTAIAIPTDRMIRIVVRENSYKTWTDDRIAYYTGMFKITSKSKDTYAMNKDGNTIGANETKQQIRYYTGLFKTTDNSDDADNGGMK